MCNVTVTFPVTPKPKLRPRFKCKYNQVITFTPLETKIFENQIKDYYGYVAKGYCFEKGTPLSIDLIFGMPIPASESKKRKADMIAGLLLPTKKPDLDNLTKSVLDALNGVAWHDDAQIVTLHVTKQYVTDPYIKLTIHGLYTRG